MIGTGRRWGARSDQGGSQALDPPGRRLSAKRTEAEPLTGGRPPKQRWSHWEEAASAQTRRQGVQRKPKEGGAAREAPRVHQPSARAITDVVGR